MTDRQQQCKLTKTKTHANDFKRRKRKEKEEKTLTVFLLEPLNWRESVLVLREGGHHEGPGSAVADMLLVQPEHIRR